MVEAQCRHLGNAERAAGGQPTVAGDHVTVAIDQDRGNEAECPDAFGNLPDLLLGVAPRVCGVRFQLDYSAINDL